MPKINRIVFGIVAILLAMLGQNRLEKNLLFDAVLFYGAGIILLLTPFFWTKLPELSLNLADAEEERWLGLPEWSQSWWWQTALLLVNLLALGSCIWALYEFNQDFYRPASHAWPLYIASLLIFLLAVALLDGAPYALWWLTNSYLRRPAFYEPDAVPYSPLRLIVRFTRLLRALAASGGYLLGFWRIGIQPPPDKISEPMNGNGQRYEADPETDLTIRKLRQPRPVHNLPWSRRHTVVFVIAFVTAIFMRLYDFAEWPIGTWYDEAAAGLMGLRMVEDPTWRPVFPGSINITAHYTFLVAKAVELFGPSVQAVRSVSVIMGLLAVPAAYMAGRELFGRTIGLIFMCFMATSSWPVDFSRIGMYNIATPLFELLALAYLLMALRRNRYLDFALAGLFLGLGLSFYPAFQLFVAATGIYLLYKIIFVRGFLARYWYGLVVTTVMAVMVLSPLALFAYKESDVYFARTRETSLLTTKEPNELLPALLSNTRKHLLMFNYEGDPNGRHNLPGHPMMDPFTGALMVLGLVITLRWFWRPRTFYLLIWLALGLLGGILSLDFEAPQSLRSIATQPVVYLLATLPIYLLWREWSRSVEPYFEGRFLWLGLALVVPVALSNGYTYFIEQRNNFAVWNAYSTPETTTANLIKELDDQTDAYVISYFHGHPAINYLARGARPFERIETTDHLPLAWEPGRDVLMIMNADSGALFNEARRFYPNAEFNEVQPPFGGPTILYTARLDQSDITGIQGLNGFYYNNTSWSGRPVKEEQVSQISLDWTERRPLDEPFSVEWWGVLKVEHFGEHQFFLQAPDRAELYIGENRVITTGNLNDNDEATDAQPSADGSETVGASLQLAEGNHSVRLRVVGAPGLLNLAWRPPDRSYEIVPSNALYVPPVSSNGLLGNYYANDNWEGAPALARIDANFSIYFHVTPLPRPYTVEWTGKIAIPASGTYLFGLESIDESALLIDGETVVTALDRNQYVESPITLETGLYDIDIRFSDRTDHTHINLYWTPPGGVRQIVPSEVLFPPQASYERVALPSAAQLQFDPSQPDGLTFITPELPGMAEPFVSGFADPIGIARGLDGTLFVSDPPNRQVLAYSPEGQLLTQIRGTGGASDDATSGVMLFEEPFDLDTDSQGRLLVLDAGTNLLSVHSGEAETLGEFEAYIPIDPSLLLRSRGLHVDGQDQIWVPMTPRGRVGAFNMEGQQLLDFPIWPGENSQPVDVAVGPDGNIWVTDAGLYKLIRFDSEGQRLLAWDIPEANTLHGPHLTVDDEGFLYITEPESKSISKLGPDGERLGQWSLAPGLSATAKPVGIDVEPDGTIWYTDSENQTISRIEMQ